MPVPAPLRMELRGSDPEGQARPRTFAGPSGRAVTFSPKTQFYKDVARLAAWRRPKFPLDGPLELEVVLLFKRPKSVPLQQWYKWTRPDGDNVLKAVQDALSEARWFTEDSRVVKATVTKRYVRPGDEPGVVLTVSRLPDPNWSDE